MSEVLLIDAVAGFLDSLRAAKKSPHTVSAYQRDLEAVAELLVDPINKPVAEMTMSDVELIDLNGKPPLGAASVTFSVQPDQAHVVSFGDSASRGIRHVEGSAGCSSFSGAYALAGDRLFVVSLAQTQADCGDQLTNEERLFVGIVTSASWMVNRDQLTLTGSDGSTATFREVATNLVVGVWTLNSFNSEPVEKSVSLTFDADNRVSGYSGCWVRGEYEITGDVLSLSALPRSRAIMHNSQCALDRHTFRARSASSVKLG